MAETSPEQEAGTAPKDNARQPAGQSPQDKRNAPRRGIERPVQIILTDTAPIPCALSDVSTTGARLSVADPAAIPNEFEILFKDDLRKWCRVMRRSETHIGIKFIPRPQAVGETPSPSVVPADTAGKADAEAKTKKNA